MLKIIINADDLGISHEVNKKIGYGLAKGYLSSSTIMANAPAFEDGIRIAKLFPQKSFGVHLNLIEFSPLTSSALFSKYGMVNSEGNFIEGAVFTIKTFTEELKNAIYEELDAQIEHVKACGLIPSHIDSHQHTHTIYELRYIIEKLMKKHNIKHVRRSAPPNIRLMLRNDTREQVNLDKSKAKVVKRSLLERRIHLLKVIYKSNKWNRFFCDEFALTDCFYAYRTFLYNFDLLGKKLSNQTIELMCHPGHLAYENETVNVYKDALTDITSYQLITYNDL